MTDARTSDIHLSKVIHEPGSRKDIDGGHIIHSCRIIMVAMDGEHRQADVDVLVLKIRSTKQVLQAGCVITDHLELHRPVVEAAPPQDLDRPHQRRA